jgi:hypothetical protein
MGLLLGTRSPGRHVSFPVSFSHQSVGSSILASLSEAGGNEPRKSASKPLPPRSPFFLARYSKRAHSPPECTPLTNPSLPLSATSSADYKRLTFVLLPLSLTHLHLQDHFGIPQFCFGNSPLPPSLLCPSPMTSRTFGSKSSVFPNHRFFSPLLPQSGYAIASSRQSSLSTALCACGPRSRFRASSRFLERRHPSFLAKAQNRRVLLRLHFQVRQNVRLHQDV